MLETCIGPSRLDRPKPYGYAMVDEDFVDGFVRARSAWTDALQGRGLAVSFADAIAAGPRDDPDRRCALDRDLRARWTDAVATAPFDAASWLERIATAHLEEGFALCESPDASWCFDTVFRLVERFEAFGCVHALYDGEFRRVVRAPNQPRVLVRLALATAWTGASTDDASRRVQLLNALLKVDDLLQAMARHGDVHFDPQDGGFVLAALTLEAQLLARVREDAGGPGGAP